VTDPGCRIVALSNRFGLRGVSNCKACDRCRGTPVAKTAVVAKRKAATDTTSENKALQVLRRLESVCMFCNSDLCNGETCLGPRACYKCGAKHFSKDCNADLKAVLENRACYQCLDLHSRRNYQSHEIQKCPKEKESATTRIYSQTDIKNFRHRCTEKNSRVAIKNKRCVPVIKGSNRAISKSERKPMLPFKGIRFSPSK
jgi:hypothetical protein